LRMHDAANLQKFHSAKKIYSSQTSRSRCFLPTIL
jgi:hypothetical protein